MSPTAPGMRSDATGARVVSPSAGEGRCCKCPARAWALLGGLVVGVGAAGVVGLIDDTGELRDLFLQRRLDPLLQGDVDHAAPLAAAAELEIGDVLLDVQELDPAAVRGHG